MCLGFTWGRKLPGGFRKPILSMSHRHYLTPTPQQQVLQGRLTIIGLVIAALGAFAQQLGLTFPEKEAQDLGGHLAQHWDTFAKAAGLMLAFYGRLRINWRRAA